MTLQLSDTLFPPQIPFWVSGTQIDVIIRERILEHFLPISKQTPKSLACKEC